VPTAYDTTHMPALKLKSPSAHNEAIRISLEDKFAQLVSSLGSQPRDDARSGLLRDHTLAEQIISSFLDNSGTELVKVLNGDVTYFALHQLEVVRTDKVGTPDRTEVLARYKLLPTERRDQPSLGSTTWVG
jgi:hypothetical protein